ncbi:MAG: acyl-CoA dehydrogenase [Pseudomonadota bacterium]|nr:acyl-CoA dehydrogenase [Pseudomonadota bacterium]
MADYRAPIKDMFFAIRELADLEALSNLPDFEEVTPDLIEAILEEAGHLASEIYAPTNVIGDIEGSKFVDGEVKVPTVFKSAYQAFVEGGWPGIAHNPEYGGQGLPFLLSNCVDEMMQSANLSLSLCAMLTHDAIYTIEIYGDESIRSTYLEKMISGSWTGTMNLTEPQAGSDLSLLRTQAIPDGEAYKISGQKIFITWGDHDMAENVIHLVLARIPNAPSGTKGISLFLVPKFIPNPDGTIGRSNGVETASIEHKLGIHGSPTCVLDFSDAQGYLIGEPNKGLACMFTMMNRARLGVGLEGVAVSERSYQQALVFAKERIQGHLPGKSGNVAIIEHPDVRRMLLTMKVEIEAMRASAYVTASHVDKADHLNDQKEQHYHQSRVDLLIPIIKGWLTERSKELTGLGIQIHGGMGYIEETGAAQYLRDAMILSIYEGTTGIQAGDLVNRKILRDHGSALNEFFLDIQQTLDELSNLNDYPSIICERLSQGLDQSKKAAEWLKIHASKDVYSSGAVSYHFLMMLGTLMGGWQMALAASAAQKKLDQDKADKEWLKAKILSARFYAEQCMPRITTYTESIFSGSDTIMAYTLDQFESD